MKKLTDEEREKDHVASYWEDRHHNTKWSDEATIDLSDHPYKLLIFVDDNTLEEHRVMQGQVCINDWLSDEEEFEVVRYLSELWPHVEMP